MSKIKTIIFDYAGVLTRTPGFDVFIDKYGEGLGKTKEEFYYIFKKNWSELSRGRGNPDDYWKELSLFLEVPAEEIKTKLLSTFPIDHELLTSIKRLKNKFNTVLMSNQIKGWIETALLPGSISDYFTHNFSSYVIGLKKPEPEAFGYLLKSLKVKPEECLYFDDQPDNLSAASQLGINSVLYREYTDFSNMMSKFNIDLDG